VEGIEMATISFVCTVVNEFLLIVDIEALYFILFRVRNTG
jgi:hypothetical protein